MSASEAPFATRAFISSVMPAGISAEDDAAGCGIGGAACPTPDGGIGDEAEAVPDITSGDATPPLADAGCPFGALFFFRFPKSSNLNPILIP